MNETIWDKICATFTHLFQVTTPDALFFDYKDKSFDNRSDHDSAHNYNNNNNNASSDTETISSQARRISDASSVVINDSETGD